MVVDAKIGAILKREQSRGQPRMMLRLATTAFQGNGPAAAEVHNLSTVGLLLRTESELVLDAPLTVVLPNAGERGATVVWSDGDLYGCRFIEPLSVADLSAALLRATPHGLWADDPQEPEPESFGTRLRRHRKQARYSLIGLGQIIGVSKPTVWKWETDQVRPRRAAMTRLAEVFGVSEAELMYGSAGREAALQANAAPGAAPGDAMTLAVLIGECRSRIASKAGIGEERVSITIDWN